MKKILKFIGKYKIFLVLSVLLATVSVILQLYVPILFGDAIDQIVAEHQVQFDAMWILLREILVLVAISALATWVMNMINNHMTYHIVQDIRSSNPSYSAVTPVLSGPSQFRRYCKPDHCRYRYFV